MIEQTILWRKLDSPGHDACGLWVLDDGWRLAGMTVFLAEGQPCCLRYEVRGDASWRTRSARADGWMGNTAVNIEIIALPGERWSFNGAEQAQLAGLVDVDLGFTPATNLIPFRRLALEIGDAAEAPAAYLHFPELRMERLEQRYHRVAVDRYAYQSPSFSYDATLQVSDAGFVTQYPGLWEQETIDGR